MSKKRILLFEDSDMFADILLEFLHEAGYTTRRAINGFEGIKEVYQFLPHLIITDVEMPLFKGYQATRLLKSRKHTRNIPIIMFTALGETKDRFWGGQAGADCYIEKSPDNFDELNHYLEALLAESRDIDYAAIEKEGKRINDNALIEMVNNLLDNKLFQMTIIGMLAELSSKLACLEDIVQGVFELLAYICETEILSIMIKSSGNVLFVYTMNQAGYTAAIANDFTAITIADFFTLFPDFTILAKHTKDFAPPGDKAKRIESYQVIPLSIAGEQFATVHIANSIKEYFSPFILENLNIFLAATAPIVANALSLKQMEELQSKTRIAFARYVPIDVMDEIINKSSASVNQSETRNVAVLFVDIRNFTKITENSNAHGVVSFLNDYFSLMGNEIIAEGGYIDKFIGDEIMAVFGAPKTLPNAPVCAIRGALKMITVLTQVNTSSITLPESGFVVGIGINYGPCIVGNIGFYDKQDYTAIGDTVNLASRLEGVTKYYCHPIIVSENMYEAAKGMFLFRKVDSVRVKGKNQPVGLYAVYAAYREDIKDDRVPASLLLNRELLDQYNKGLKLYYMREWETAGQYFSNALKLNPQDYLSALYLERVVGYLKKPPPENWDITTTLTEK
ncbi:MAG: response regulator [Treponema sp.]|jgi:class 3 adenylate cyclase/DNA-binding response OmpR family regulator|nr:response regulator [Treponema sp.]